MRWSVVLGFSAFAFMQTSRAFIDDCEFIRQKLKQLPATGGVVSIPSGEYTCRLPIVMDRPHASLRGQGKVKLKLADHANAPLLVLGETLTPPKIVQDVEVENLYLNGNKEKQDMECWGGPCDSGGTTFIRNNGITVRNVHQGRVKNVRIKGSRSGGLVSEHNTKYLHVDNLISQYNFFDGLAACETTDSVFSNLTLTDNVAAGISTDLSFNRNLFKNALLLRNQDVGIFMRRSNENIFQHLVVKDSGSFGVFLADAGTSDGCAANNEFHNFAALNSKYAGIRLNDPCPGNKLTGNSVILSNQGGCVSLAPGSNLINSGEYFCDE